MDFVRQASCGSASAGAALSDEAVSIIETSFDRALWT